MGKRIVIALGGNALGNNLPEQMVAVKHTAKAIVDLIQEGHQVVVAHGNGPQVGMINIAMTTLSREDHSHPIAPMSVCTAMSQGYIGYDLQNSLREELLNRGIQKPVATVLTQVEVDPADPAFQNPSKPIGTFMTEEEAEEMRRRGNCVMEDAGRGCPVDWNEKEQRYNWELVYCELYAGGKYDNVSGDNYEYSLGLNGLGACATQYASRYMDVTV